MYDPSLPIGVGAAATTCRPVTAVSLCRLNCSSEGLLLLLLLPLPLLEANSFIPAAGSELSSVPNVLPS